MSDLSDDDKRRIDEWAESLKVAWPWWLPLVILAIALWFAIPNK